MARHIGPKNKLMRRVSTDLSLKSNPVKVGRRLNILPGMHGKRGRGKVSEFGIQLQEKQKVKFLYGVLERQLHRYFEQATRQSEATGTALLNTLERRLDNVVYRLRLAPTRAAARQLVNHGNVKVNDAKLTIPSYQVRMGDVITLTDTATKIPYISSLLSEKSVGIPEWLSRTQNKGKVNRLPERTDISEPIDEQLIVEFYSK